MKNLLFIAALLFSSVAFAVDTTLQLQGVSVEKDQVVKVEVRGNTHYFIDMFRASATVGENDEIQVMLDDMPAGKYEVRITVYENNVENRKTGKFAIGKIVSQQIKKINVE